MRKLTVVSMGEEVQGIVLRGDRRNPEPTHVRVSFPGGDVDVVRTEDGEYWVHTRVNTPEQVREWGEDVGAVAGKLVDARLDVKGKHASETDAGDFAHPDLYHLAVRVARRGR